MFRTASRDPFDAARLDQLFQEVSREVFGPDEELMDLDFATIEQRAHEVGQRVARRLAEDAAAKQARSVEEPQPCPHCQRPCGPSIKTRELQTQDGLISLEETSCYCSRCRRAFFPQQSEAAARTSALQPAGPGQGSFHGNRESLVRGSRQGSPDHRVAHDHTASSSNALPRGRRRTRRGAKNADEGLS